MLDLRKAAYRLADFHAWNMAGGKRAGSESVTIVMLHGVHDRDMERLGRAPSNSLPLDGLIGGLKELRRRYSIVSLDSAVRMVSGEENLKPFSLVITFDDSLKCLARVAAPALAKAGIPATFYLSTEVIDNQRQYWWKRLEAAVANTNVDHLDLVLPSGDRMLVHSIHGVPGLATLKTALKQLSGPQIENLVAEVEIKLNNRPREVVRDHYAEVLDWNDVTSMVEMGMTIGAHTVSHPNLSLLSPSDVTEEVTISKQRIEEATGRQCNHMCYPYGSFTDEVVSAVREAGYQSAVTTEAPGWNRRGDDLLRLSRFAMPFLPYEVNATLAGFGGFRGMSIKVPESSLIDIFRPTA